MLQSKPVAPFSHPFGQLPLTGLHSSVSLQCAQSVLHSRPKVPLSQTTIGNIEIPFQAQTLLRCKHQRWTCFMKK